MTTTLGTFRGIDYSPYRDGESPGVKDPSPAEIDQDFSVLPTMGNAIRTFSVSLQHGLDYVVQKAISLGLEAIPSAYLNDVANSWAPAANQEEMDSLAYVLNHSDLSKIPFAVVGSEASLQNF